MFTSKTVPFLLISAALCSIGLCDAQATKPFHLVCTVSYSYPQFGQFGPPVGNQFSVSVPSEGVEMSESQITYMPTAWVRIVIDRLSGSFQYIGLYQNGQSTPYSSGKCKKATANKF